MIITSLMLDENLEEQFPKTTDAFPHLACYIQEHYRNRISLREIAESASISERECLRCFSQNLNTTPFTYLTEYRIQKAAGELSLTNQAVTEIAYGCGFTGTSYFSKIFKKVMGCTPSEYRNSQKKIKKE